MFPKNPFNNALPNLGGHPATVGAIGATTAAMTIGLCSPGAITNPPWNTSLPPWNWTQFNNQGENVYTVPNPSPAWDWGSGTMWFLSIPLHWTGSAWTGLVTFFVDKDNRTSLSRFADKPIVFSGEYDPLEYLISGNPGISGHLFADIPDLLHLGIGLNISGSPDTQYSCAVTLTQFEPYNNRLVLASSGATYPVAGLNAGIVVAGTAPRPPIQTIGYQPSSSDTYVLKLGPQLPDLPVVFGFPGQISFSNPYVFASQITSFGNVFYNPTSIATARDWINFPLLGAEVGPPPTTPYQVFAWGNAALGYDFLPQYVPATVQLLTYADPSGNQFSFPVLTIDPDAIAALYPAGLGVAASNPPYYMAVAGSSIYNPFSGVSIQYYQGLPVVVPGQSLPPAGYTLVGLSTPAGWAFTKVYVQASYPALVPAIGDLIAQEFQNNLPVYVAEQLTANSAQDLSPNIDVGPIPFTAGSYCQIPLGKNNLYVWLLAGGAF